jgi:BirA family transcriptional regulator, biotin operon repressor / biotin---[acetyl-CoA-carboxylase] ligase
MLSVCGCCVHVAKTRVAAKRSPSAAERHKALLSILADAEFHSGARLAKSLRVSRSAVWKFVGALRELGIDVESAPRLGYRLPRAVDLLDEQTILNRLGGNAGLEQLDVLLTVDSTNRHLLDAPPPAHGAMRVCTTEIQRSGRGRRGRSWTAPFGSGVCLSVSWQFAETPPEFSALGLVVGIAVVRTLVALGAMDVKLKWPNDLLWQQRKLGGILIEMRGEAGGPAKVVIGMGINVRMPAEARLELAKQNAVLLADLHEILPTLTPNRSELIGAIVQELAKVLPTFAMQGLTPFRSEWRTFDAIADTPIKVLTQSDTVLGYARGIAADGSLLVEVDGELQQFVSGEVSVRPVAPSTGARSQSR